MTLNLYAKPEYKMRLLARVKWWFRRAKYARQRARWGFSEYDVWDMDTYLAELIGNMAEYLSEHTNSYPYDMDEKDWKAILKTISKCFKQYNIERPCLAYEEYQASLVRKTEDEEFGRVVTFDVPEEVAKTWAEEEYVNHNAKMEELKHGFGLLYKHFPDLWD